MTVLLPWDSPAVQLNLADELYHEVPTPSILMPAIIGLAGTSAAADAVAVAFSLFDLFTVSSQPAVSLSVAAGRGMPLNSSRVMAWAAAWCVHRRPPVRTALCWCATTWAPSPPLLSGVSSDRCPLPPACPLHIQSISSCRRRQHAHPPKHSTCPRTAGPPRVANSIPMFVRCLRGKCAPPQR